MPSALEARLAVVLSEEPATRVTRQLQLNQHGG